MAIMATEAENKQVKQNQIVISAIKQIEWADKEERGWSRVRTSVDGVVREVPLRK